MDNESLKESKLHDGMSEASKNANDRFVSQLNNLAIPIIIYTKIADQFNIVFKNKAYVTSGPDKSVPEFDLSCFHFDNSEHGLVELITKCFQEKSVFETEKIFLDSQNKISYLNLSFVFTPPGIVLIMLRDISAQKNTEKSLYENEKKYHSLFDLSPVGFALNRIGDGKFIEYNRALYETLGYQEDEFKKLDYWDITPRELEDQELVLLRQLYEEGHYGPYVKEYIHKEGHRIPVLLKGVLLRDIKGGDTIFSIIQDMTERLQAQEAIEELGQILDESLNEIYIIDRDSLRFLYANKGAILNLGFTKDEILNMTPADISPTFKAEVFQSRIQQLVDKNQKKIAYISQHQRCDKSVYDIEIHIQMSSYNNKSVIIGIANDITERKKAHDQLNKLTQAVEQSPNAIFITDLDGHIEYANRKFETINGYSKEEYLGKKPAILNSKKMPAGYHKELWQTIKSEKEWYKDICNRKKDGSTYWARQHISLVRNSENQVTHYLSITQDITKIRENEQRILHQAQYDQLTNVPNRFLGMERLEQSIRNAVDSGNLTLVLFIDLDNFKNINDNLGHAIGDLVLIEAANRLSDSIRKEDTVIRFGGDEFLIILDSIASLEQASQNIKKIHSIFKEPYYVDGNEIYVTASSGISVSPNHGTDPAELIRYADSAMYLSKSRGRNTSHLFDPVENKNIESRFDIERELRVALYKNEFYIQYQPFVNLETGQIIGAEALLRWANPKLGNISPIEFIPIAEQTGIIESIGEYVLKTACYQMKSWEPLLSKSFQMSINLSPRQFRNGQIVSVAKNLLRDIQIDARQIKLEITEGVLFQSHDRPIELMHELKKLGFSIGMDDFGTGYSSLQNLRKFPFDLLKIDQIFIRDMLENKDARIMVETIIAMCKSLGIDVLAEGIEKVEQLNHVKKHGCKLAQGYLFSKPVMVEEFEQLLISNKFAQIVDSGEPNRGVA